MSMYTSDHATVAQTSRALPQAAPDTFLQAQRAGRYGENVSVPLSPDMYGFADEGTYFVVNNAQTGLATGATPTAFSATNPFLLIYNSDSPGTASAKRIYLDYAMLLATAAGTAGASVQFAVVIDNGNRYTSGGTNLTSLIVNPNGGAPTRSIANVYGGNLTVVAASSASRMVVGNRYMKGAIPVIGDQYSIKFGGVDSPSFIGISTILTSLNNVPKVVLDPNQTATVHLWLPTQSAASSYAPEVGWIER